MTGTQPPPAAELSPVLPLRTARPPAFQSRHYDRSESVIPTKTVTRAWRNLSQNGIYADRLVQSDRGCTKANRAAANMNEIRAYCL